MRPKGRIVLVELLIAFLFFSLSAVIALQLFARGYAFSQNSALRADALREAQSLADRLFASDSAEALLAEAGFERDGAAYERAEGDVLFLIELSARDEDAGILKNAAITVRAGDQTLFKLPVARYERRSAP